MKKYLFQGEKVSIVREERRGDRGLAKRLGNFLRLSNGTLIRAYFFFEEVNMKNEEPGLRHKAFDRMMVREFCNLSKITHPLWTCVGDKKKLKRYAEEEKAAEEMFKNIMRSPSRIRDVVGAYLVHLNAKKEPEDGE